MEQQWEHHIKNQESSSQTVKEYCQAHGLKLHQFYTRKRELRSNKKGRSSKVSMPQFSQVKLTPPRVPQQKTETLPPADWVAEVLLAIQKGVNS